MSLELVRLDDLAPQPWRNGGGRTRELLAWPDGQRWSLRLSVAGIERDGPFSAFPGVERWLAVVAGAGVELHFAARSVRCLPGDGPLRFDGGDAPEARLIDGPTEDLNLMLAAGSAGWMLRAEPGSHAPPAGTLRALYAADAVGLRRGGAAVLAVAAGSLVWAVGAAALDETWRLEAAPGTRAWWIGHEARAVR
ncbi:HutD family protein [uncultured Methylibium sp.]|uniref:HutD/Ves family protein n=1 Tax=uncultured Methylibium sp. TaxID=381093 RepID=UPI0025EC3A11|nr:HutD family protein [uncultured Methylibium sp.]